MVEHGYWSLPVVGAEGHRHHPHVGQSIHHFEPHLPVDSIRRHHIVLHDLCPYHRCTGPRLK